MAVPFVRPETSDPVRLASRTTRKKITGRRVALGLVWWLMHVIMLPVLGCASSLYYGIAGLAIGFYNGLDEGHAAIEKWRRMMDRN